MQKFKQILCNTTININCVRYTKEALECMVKKFKPVPIKVSYNEQSEIIGFIENVKIEGDNLIGFINLHKKIDRTKYCIGYEIITNKKDVESITTAELIGGAKCELKNSALNEEANNASFYR